MSDEKLSPRAALEALGFTFRLTRRGRAVEVTIPGGRASWEDDDVSWPDSDDAREYVFALLISAEDRAVRARRLADAREAKAREAEAQAAKTRDVMRRMR